MRSHKQPELARCSNLTQFNHTHTNYNSPLAQQLGMITPHIAACNWQGTFRVISVDLNFRCRSLHATCIIDIPLPSRISTCSTTGTAIGFLEYEYGYAMK